MRITLLANLMTRFIEKGLTYIGYVSLLLRLDKVPWDSNALSFTGSVF